MTMAASKADAKGVITEAFPNALFRVTIESGKDINAFMSGKMRFNHIKLLIGDKVEILLDKNGGSANMIKRRL